MAAADSAMPEVTHRMVETNGIRLHVAEQGDGPLIILCHGFPECWYSWRHQLPALAKAGFRVAAPDLRGYGLSDRPKDVENYTILDNIGDLVGLADALGASAGRDRRSRCWRHRSHGKRRSCAPTVSGLLSRSARRSRSRGFGDAGPPTTLMPRTKNAVFYQLFLQTPEAEVAFERDLRNTFRAQFYTLSGNVPPSAGGGAFAGGMGAAAERRSSSPARRRCRPGSPSPTLMFTLPNSARSGISAVPSPGTVTSTAVGSLWLPLVGRR